ncbi:MAG TPA: hypothetical protein VFS41_00895 [Edaphobacter sp.]|nr:hypothetical protein [Edaphobacter sp.]
MKRFLLLFSVAFVVFIAVYRQRIFLRDPLATVYQNGQKQQGARVYINYSNDILVLDTGDVPSYMVQNWNRQPGVPQSLNCLHAMTCWTDHDRATLIPLEGSAGPATMSDREVSFRRNDGSIRVTLR